MIAGAMQVATGASGDTTIYCAARDVLAMRMLSSYCHIAVGHGDGGMGDTFWRGVSSVLAPEHASDQYRAMMDRLAWWYDLARRKPSTSSPSSRPSATARNRSPTSTAIIAP